eukprot:jgi/Botrbrau1/3372/Bobra.0337s0013.1
MFLVPALAGAIAACLELLFVLVIIAGKALLDSGLLPPRGKATSAAQDASYEQSDEPDLEKGSTDMLYVVEDDSEGSSSLQSSTTERSEDLKDLQSYSLKISDIPASKEESSAVPAGVTTESEVALEAVQSCTYSKEYCQHCKCAEKRVQFLLPPARNRTTSPYFTPKGRGSWVIR